MSSHPVFRNTIYSQEQIDLMSAAYERVSQDLGVDEANATRDSIANAILECARKGIFNPFDLRKCAHEVLNSA